MRRWLCIRLAWMVVSLLGITFVTFAVLDLAPVDRAQLAVARQQGENGLLNLAAREQAILRLRVRYGLVDPDTLEPAPMWRRYGNWLGNALSLRFAGPNEDDRALWRRLMHALPVTLWLGFLSLLVVGAVGVPLGAWLGMRAGSTADRLVSRFLFMLVGIPEFLLATLLLFGLCGLWLSWFPSGGLRSPGAESWSIFRQIVDFAWHLVLPVVVMATGPTVLVVRFLRDTVARASGSGWAANLRALGTDDATLRWRLVRNGAAPLATLAGTLLPMLVSGSIVVENLFALDGIGHLAFQAVGDQDQSLVMALVVVTSTVTLLSLIASDLGHRLVDPRVRMSS
ncbi:MAG: ABC transporter permease [Planctomycetota bacterium]